MYLGAEVLRVYRALRGLGSRGLGLFRVQVLPFAVHLAYLLISFVLLNCALTPRYLLYRVLEPLGPFFVGTWRVRVCSLV